MRRDQHFETFRVALYGTRSTFHKLVLFIFLTIDLESEAGRRREYFKGMCSASYQYAYLRQDTHILRTQTMLCSLGVFVQSLHYLLQGIKL